jgi:iron(III) transport system ATP-binding protein
MSVYENIAFPLRRGVRRVARPEVQRRTDRVLELMHLTDYADRPTSTLSGGQQQRVALARALALEPAVLLMDEPLSNLDSKLRAQLRVELKELAKSTGMTTLYVTHDQVEAMVMGDRVAVMNGGIVLQEGVPAELYQRPRHLFVARFLGEMNFVEGVIKSCTGEFAEVETPAGPLSVTRAENVLERGKVLVGFRPEDAVLLQAPRENTLPGTISASYYLGDVLLYDIAIGAGVVQVRRPKSEVLEPGLTVFVHVPRACCLAFAEDAPAAPASRRDRMDRN